LAAVLPASTLPGWRKVLAQMLPFSKWTWNECVSWTSRLHTAHTLYSSEAHLMELLPAVDLLIGAVLVPGAKAPKLIGRDMFAQDARRQRAGGHRD